MSLYKVGSTWYAYVKHKGKRVRRSTGFSDREAAQRFHDELKAELWQHAPGRAGRTWLDACLAWLKAKARSKSDRYSLKALAYTDRPIEECTAESLEACITDKAPATFNRIADIINAILNTAKEKGWVEKVEKVKHRDAPPTDVRFLTLEEWERLHHELPAHLKAPARLSLATGLRQANVFKLKWAKVDLSRRMVWVASQETKNRKPLGIPLSDDAVAVLKEQQALREDECEWVFPFKGKGRAAGQPITEVKTAFYAAMERAKLGHYKRWKTKDGKQHKEWIGDVNWHTFRHTFASWHVMSGTPLEVLQKLGGWSSLRMVQRYAHLAPGHIASFANNAKPWSSKESKKAA